MATLLELAVEIVKAHASVTKLTTDELLATIEKVHSQLRLLESGGDEKEPAPAESAKSVLSVRQAFKANEVICMVCGKGGMKTLARHLRQAHDMKPGEYRKQFNIPKTQKLTARKLTEARQQRAKEMNLAANLEKARKVRAEKLKKQKKTAQKTKK